MKNAECFATRVARPEVRRAWRNRTSATPITYGSERATPVPVEVETHLRSPREVDFTMDVDA